MLQEQISLGTGFKWYHRSHIHFCLLKRKQSAVPSSPHIKQASVSIELKKISARSKNRQFQILFKYQENTVVIDYTSSYSRITMATNLPGQKESTPNS